MWEDFPTIGSPKDFEARVIDVAGPVFVVFCCQSCPMCRPLGPIVKSLAAEYGDRVSFVTVDVRAQLDIAAAHKVLQTPVVILFEVGEVTKRWLGIQDLAEYQRVFEKVLVAD